MRKYVFLQPSICGMGGAQQYLFQKIKVLKEIGWNVVVVSAEKGEILVDDLKRYSDDVVFGLRYSVCYYNKNDIEIMVDEAINIINPHKEEEIYIESATASMALWGELIASKIRCRHVCFDFEEVFTNLTKSQLLFVDFKHRRKELAGISPKSVPAMFRGFKDVPADEAYSYNAMCSNPIANVDYNYLTELDNYKQIIGTIGRAEKPYLIPTLVKIREYTNENSDIRFAVLLIGGAKSSKYEKEAKNIFKGCKNVDFYSTGMIFPIPRKLVHKVDVFVSSSGSANATAREGIPTIAISPENFLPNGILNYTTTKSILAEETSQFTVKELLHMILNEHFCKYNESLGMYEEVPYEIKAKEEYLKQLEFVTNNSNKYEYFDVHRIKKEGLKRIICIVTRIIGRELFMKSLDLLNDSRFTFLKG